MLVSIYLEGDMSEGHLLALLILGGLWVSGVLAYLFAWVKTRTWPGQLEDDELFKRAFGDGE